MLNRGPLEFGYVVFFLTIRAYKVSIYFFLFLWILGIWYIDLN